VGREAVDGLMSDAENNDPFRPDRLRTELRFVVHNFGADGSLAFVAPNGWRIHKVGESWTPAKDGGLRYAIWIERTTVS
jgi:hypothetical protein